MKQQLLKSSFFRVIEIVIITIISLLLTPYLISHLGDDNYGLWVLILSTLGWFNFLDLGFSYAVQRHIMLALENRDNQSINVIFSVSAVLFAILGLVAALCVLILAMFPQILGVDNERQLTAGVVLSILAFKIFLDFVMNCFYGFYTAYLRMDIDANLSTLNTIIKSVLVYFFIIDMNIYGAVAATIIADISTHSMKAYFARKLHPDFHFSLKLVRFSKVKELFSYSKHLVAADIANSLNRRVDPIIISHLLGLKFVALYTVVNNLVNQIESLVLAITGIFQPVFTRMVTRGNDVNGMFKQVVSINYFVVLLFYTPLAIFAEDFILLWIGAEYATAANLAYILGFAYICRTISRPINALLLAQANHKLLSVANLAGAVINVILSLWLGILWGLYGVAIATACAFFISDVVLYLLLLKRYTNMPILTPLLQFFLISGLYGFSVLAGKQILLYIPPLSWLELLVASGISVILMVCVAWLLVLSVETRSKLVNIILTKES
ncbi:MAG: oligosaccharide flippase family protein [Colwellia sp.]|nr:oligosaccharide flippase family protein [Colwellia sp.]